MSSEQTQRKTYKFFIFNFPFNIFKLEVETGSEVMGSKTLDEED